LYYILPCLVVVQFSRECLEQKEEKVGKIEFYLMEVKDFSV